MITITALNVYPVKSCRGIALQSALLTAAGFAHDREWMVVRPDGRFLTQREQPRLALVEPSLSEEALELRAPGMSPLHIPFAQPGREVEVTCWGDRCAAFDAGDAAAQWLAGYLQTACRLVRFDARRPRPSNPQWTRGLEALNRFSDGYPWLLISQASLDDLNARLDTPLPMNRFRPNIVVTGLRAYGEDEIQDFAGDGVRLRAVKACTRCVITTTNQATGERNGTEPLNTLRQYRFDRELKGVLFGQNLLLLEGEGRRLHVGQQLAVQERLRSAAST